MKPNDKKESANSLLVENLHAPEIFASNIPHFSIGNGIVTMTLCSMRFDNSATPPEKHLVTVGRVVIPIASARALASALHAFLEQQGVHAITAEDKKHLQ